MGEQLPYEGYIKDTEKEICELLRKLATAKADIARLEHERNALATAIGEALVELGVVQPAPLAGPELIAFLGSYAKAQIDYLAGKKQCVS